MYLVGEAAQAVSLVGYPVFSSALAVASCPVSDQVCTGSPSLTQPKSKS